MEQYIKKSTLLTEIDNILDYIDEHWDTDYAIGAQRFADKLQDAIDTLKVKEVDFVKEFYTFSEKHKLMDKDIEFADIEKTASFFFQLGLLASNPITAEDRGIAEEIIINLKRVEKDYRINLTTEISWLMDKVKNNK